jgi:enoyl-CoA hydratase/carnithine racemase
MEYEEIIYKLEDGIATITLNRPERLNAFSPKMLTEWADAIERSRVDDDVKVVVVTGAGRAFCVGANVRGFVTGEDAALASADLPLAERRHTLRNGVHRVPRALATLDKPYVASVNGPATGAGMDMASMADMRIASDKARFGMTYVRMGLVPGDGGCYFLPRIVGLARACELIWTGRIIDADEALRIGYVTRVVAAEQLEAATRELALQLARGPAVAIQLAKRLIYRSQEVDMDHALELAESAMLIAQSTEDAKEGPRAFLEKREPMFKGR